MITFSDKPEMVADFTQQAEDLQSKLLYAVPKGRTDLLDAISIWGSPRCGRQNINASRC
jgi:Mg-chelatase subunit ChlD